MADDKIVRSIVEKCAFYYDDALLSEENIIKKYLTFFAKQFDLSEKSVSFAFHTGSRCFDIVTVAALMIGYLAYVSSSNDEILAKLETDDMVLFRGERYRWGGVHHTSISPNDPKRDYIVLKQDAKGKNGPPTTKVLYDRNKHLVKPYYGSSIVTDGRGIRKDKTNRSDFISHILEIPLGEVPSTLDLSVVVVADKNEFTDIYKHLRIKYAEDKFVGLTDVVPVSYYTGNGEQFQIGKNASKAEAVIKVTGKMSMARELVLDKHGNRVIGLIVTNAKTMSSGSAELNDLLRRKSLKFAYVVTAYNIDSCELVMEQYESAKVFACTKELLASAHHEIKVANKLTEKLNRQISNIIKSKTDIIRVDGHWNWNQYKAIKEKLYVIKHSNWSGEDRDNFIFSTIALLNLFSTSFFSMERMEKAIGSGEINLAVVSPETKINELIDIASRSISMRDQCSDIAAALLEMYTTLYDSSPKEIELRRFLSDHKNERIAIVVPKAYYVGLFTSVFGDEYENAICVTANRFDKDEEYDRVIATGDIIGKRFKRFKWFDALQCFSAPEIALLLYEYEEKQFSFRKRKIAKSERKLNARIKGLIGDEYINAVETADNDEPDITEQIMREFSDLDEFAESMGMFDIRRLTVNSGGGEYNNSAEVKYIGAFTTGEQILFSKYHSAVVFDQNKSTVTETRPEKLVPGDILVFTKRNDYTSNIVDQIFDQLMRTHKLSKEVQDAAEKAFYWKEALRKYKDSYDLTYRAITKELKKYGSSLQEVTIRQWLIEESHIIGPRDARTMKMIAEITKDPNILGDPDGYFEACRIIRHYRREILSLIAQAINDKLSNKTPVQGSAFEVVYENVEKLSETMELESVYELDDVAVVNNGMVNRPISEAEVLM